LTGRWAVRDCQSRRTDAAVWGRRHLACGALLLLAAACQTAGGIQSRTDAAAFEAAAQQARECRTEVGQRPGYELLRRHMPLGDIQQADLRQMADPSLISATEARVLIEWSHDMQRCRNASVRAATRSGLSSYVPIVLAGWDRQDHIAVRLLQRKITWGEAVMRLKASNTTLLAGLGEEANRRLSALTRSAEAERAHRAALLNAFSGFAP
jgi:hypothetical protein